MIREILKMGDERLLRIAQPVPSELFGSEELQRLIDDMFETMHHVGGVGLAAPQIGVDLQLVIFGFERSERYPDAPAVPPTILLNPRITLLDDEMEEGWEGCLSVPGLRGAVSRHRRIRYQGLDPQGQPIDRSVEGFPCAGGAARVRPPDRPPVSLANHRLQQVRLHRGAVPRPGPRRGRLSGCACGSAPAWLSSAMGCRAAPPERVFSLVSPGVSPGRFSAVSYEFPSSRSVPCSWRSPPHAAPAWRAGWPMASAAPDGGGRFQHNAWRSARRGRRSTALSATGVVR